MITYNKPTISKKDLSTVLECMITDKVEEGELTKLFENNFSQYLGTKESVITNSAQGSLYLIFSVIHVQPGDEIILPAYTEPFILEIILSFKAVPILIDLKENCYHLDLESALEKITPKTKAVIVSHLFGYPVDLDPFLEKKPETVFLIEDCSHSIGSTYDSVHIGLKGDFSFFSFHPGRIITTGEGGAIISKVKKYNNDFRDLRSYKNQSTLRARLNFSITDIQSAMGISELSLIHKFLERRKEIGNYYKECSQKGKNIFIEPNENIYFNYGYFPLIIHSSLKIAKEMFKKYKIDARSPIEFPLFELLSIADDSFPNAKKMHIKTLSIPIYPILTKSEIETIGNLITNIR